MTEMSHTPYGGWANAYTLSNGMIELVITADVGPRIIRFGFPGAPNLFYQDPETLGTTADAQWHLYGGHRLWHAPEQQPRTYWPDNAPVHIERTEAGLVATQPVEGTTGIAKQIEITMHPTLPHVRLTHRLTNTGLWDIPLAAWALSVMDLGGTAILPLPPRGNHSTDLLPASTLTLWKYTHMNDPRWTWGTKYILLRAEVGGVPQKIGASVPEGWAAYAGQGGLMVKFFDYAPQATYPDNGSNCELFTNHFMLEVESLGPLTTLAPGATLTHVEDWLLFPAVAAPTRDVEVETTVMPRVNEGRALVGR